MEVRDANFNDLISLTHLMNQLGYPTSLDEMTARFQRIERKEEYKTLVAVDSAKVVGVMGMMYYFMWEENACGVRIQALVVDQECRSAGVGKMLIESAEAWAKSLGATSITLTSGNREERAAAHQFYPKMGFKLASSGYKKNI